MMKNRRRKQEGQILVIMLLIMATTLTLGLAASRQITTDLRVSRQQTESAKAYSAAEAGLEKALAGYGIDPTNLEEGYVNAVVDQQEIGNNPEVVWPSVVGQGEGMFFWLTGHDVDGAIDYSSPYIGSLTFCWKKTDEASANPAIVAVLFYDTGGSKVAYWAFDPDSRGNGFTVPASPATGDCPDGASFDYKSEPIALGTIPYVDPVFLWVRVFYADAQLGFKGDASLPVQGYVYTSTGTVAPTGAPEVISRRIQAFKSFSQPDPILLEPLTSFGSITASIP